MNYRSSRLYYKDREERVDMCEAIEGIRNDARAEGKAEGRGEETGDHGEATGGEDEQNGKTEFCGDFFTRSPASDSAYQAYRVNEFGRLWTFDIEDEFGSVRPAIKVTL